MLRSLITHSYAGGVKPWQSPDVPRLSSSGRGPDVYCTAEQGPVQAPGKEKVARLYVCGITPYDSTHLGHAATYVAFDVLQRVWRDAGVEVSYVQNITDIDDPLLERADATGVDWRDLADGEIERFRGDMEALRVIAPDHYIGAVESIDLVVSAVTELLRNGYAYRLDNGDVYYRVNAAIKPAFGSESHYDRETMMRLFGERGGDPDTPGKEDPLDALLWRAEREGEPSWDGGELGPGRPGWHIECAAIANEYLGFPLTIQGGGSDLIFPHHEMCAAHATALTGEPFAQVFMHTGMVGYEGEKMSKSRGNLVFVSKLRESGVDPMAVRLTLLAHHYRCDWSYSDEVLEQAQQRLATWRKAAALGSTVSAADVIDDVRHDLSDDLDTPSALSTLDRWAATTSSEGSRADTEEIVEAIDALLGIKL